jgi:hypothetical protein
MKRLLLSIAFLVIAGCPFTRPMPTEAEYKRRFLSYLSTEQVKNLEFSYRGATGGESSIAKFTVDASAVKAIRLNAQREETYTPDDANEAKLRRKIMMCTRDGQIPTWFDFPFKKAITIFIDSNERSSVRPSYTHEWYVDSENGVVYLVTVEG